MQQQFAAEKQQMSEQMQRMVQENQQLRSHSSSSSSSASAAGPTHSSSPPVSAPRIDIRLMQPSPFHGTASSNATQWLMEVERYFLAVEPRREHTRLVAYKNHVRLDLPEGHRLDVVLQCECGVR